MTLVMPLFGNMKVYCPFLVSARKGRKEADLKGAELLAQHKAWLRTPQAKPMNYSMIATGNHSYFDSLRGAPPL